RRPAPAGGDPPGRAEADARGPPSPRPGREAQGGRRKSLGARRKSLGARRKAQGDIVRSQGDRRKVTTLNPEPSPLDPRPWIKPIPHTRLREDIARVRGIVLDLAAQPAYVDPQVLRLVTILRAPHAAQQLAVAQHGVGAGNQLLQERVFGGRQLD